MVHKTPSSLARSLSLLDRPTESADHTESCEEVMRKGEALDIRELGSESSHGRPREADPMGSCRE